MWRISLLAIGLIALFTALIPLSVSAQELESDDSVTLRINGPVILADTESVDVVVVISDDAEINGTVSNFLLVVDGVATIRGRVDEEIAVINGTLVLEAGAVVKNVTLYRSSITQESGSQVTGEINESSGYSFGWGSVIFSFLFWVGSTFAVLLAGLLFAAFGGKQLLGAGEVGSHRIGQSVLSSLIVWIGLPILAIVSLVSLIGIPFGIAILLIVLPAFAFVGYLVSGTWIGGKITNRGGAKQVRNPYLAALIGLLILQVVSLIPFFGGFFAVLAALYGAGAVAFYAFLGWRGRRDSNPAEFELKT